MRNTVFFGILLVALSCCRVPAIDEEEFSCPDMQWRPMPLWFWNNATVTEDKVLEQLTRMIDEDFYGGCAILPFGAEFRPEYLSEEYFDLYAAAVELAGSKGARMSVYDEYGFPSGGMGAGNGDGIARFEIRHPAHTIKRLEKQEYATVPSTIFKVQLPSGGKRMSVVAMDRNSLEVLSLASCVTEDGMLEWEVPSEGDWTVMDFICVPSGKHRVDYLSKEAVGLFVQDTHEQYFKHFGEDFGSVITSTFFDEPTMCYVDGRMWTEGFNEAFEETYGCSPEKFYPALWYDLGDGTAAMRNMMFGTRARLYSEGFMKTIADWATEHGIVSTGHQDQEEIPNPVGISGDLMLDGKYMTMPGIDKIGGDRPAENFYKVVSSSAINWDHDMVMSETFGAMGNISFDCMRRVAVEQYTKGINHLIPHACWYNDANVKFPPELSTRNPLYRDSLPDFNRFLARLNYVLARPGRHVADVAVIYPIQTLQAGHHIDGELPDVLGGVKVPGTDYNDVSRILTDELGVDFTYLHPEVLDGKCHVEDGRLVLDNKTNREAYSVLILPGMKVISAGNLDKVHEAWKQGVRVIFTTQTPDRSADLSLTDDAVREVVAEMLSSDENPAVFVADPAEYTLREALASITPDVGFNPGGELNYIHKVIDGRNVYLFANIDECTKQSDITLNIRLCKCVWMDPHSGRTCPAELSRKGGRQTCVSLDLAPSHGIFLVEKHEHQSSRK